MPPSEPGDKGGPFAKNKSERGPKVAAPPPLLFVIFLGAGLGLERLWPLPMFQIPLWAGLIPALILAAASGTLALAGFVAFKRHQTPVDPAKATTSIITSGPFGFSRNPMYLSLLLLFAALFCLGPSWWVGFFWASYYLVMVFGVIIPEEKYLAAKFGEEYQAYMAKTGRWL